MAATITKIIDPDSGAGTDYTSLSAWEAGMQKNLVSADEISVASCRSSSGTADTTRCVVNGWTTDSTRYIRIECTGTNRHSGKWNTSKYRLSVSYNGGILDIYESYTRITGLQINNTYITGAAAIIGLYEWDMQGCYISGNILKGTLCNEYSSMAGIYNLGYVSRSFIYNNIIYDCIDAGSASSGAGIRLSNVANSSHVIYNNTIHNCATGVDASGASSYPVLAKNNLVKGSTVDSYTGYWDSNSGRNVSDDTAATHAWGKNFKTGTTTGAASNKLIDSGGGFSTAKVGMVVKDSGSNYSYITAIDSDTQVSVNDNYFGSGEAYTIFENIKASATFVDEAGDDFHLAGADTGAADKGFNLYADATLAVVDDIDLEARPSGSTAFDCGADEITAVAISQPMALRNEDVPFVATDSWRINTLQTPT